MKEKGYIEIITFKLIEDVTEQQAFDGFKVLDEFQKKFAGTGYYGMDIAKLGEGQWTLVIRWQSKEFEKDTSGNMLRSDETKSFRMLINNKTVVKKVYPYY